MSHITRISSHGLALCPGCQAHIQVAEGAQSLACPFCQAPLSVAPSASQSPKAGGLVQSILSRGRQGVLAASLFGLSFSVTACYGLGPEYRDPTTEDGIDDASDGVQDSTSDDAGDSQNPDGDNNNDDSKTQD